MSALDMTDLFCGAGGSSSGAIQIPGVTVRIAANHWQLAVDTHQENHPDTDHDCADISQTDPRRYPATDILWASPECTNHSQARGKRRASTEPDLFGDVLPDAAADRSRATMWDVCRFVEAMTLRGHPYKGFVVENVVDVRYWMYFEPWKMALRTAGYCLHFVYLNSMHAQAGGLPAPQSRDRFYCVGHLNAIRCPDLNRWTRPVAWCSVCDDVVTAMQAWKKPDGQWGRYRQQYLYRCPKAACRNAVVEPAWLPAAAAIDWTMRGQRIGDRKKPLAAKTIARIEAGLRKFARPITLEAAGNTYERPGSGYIRAWPVDQSLTTPTTTLTKAVAVHPFLTIHRGDTGDGRQRTADLKDALPTATASGNVFGLLVPAGGTWNDDATSTDDVLRTRTAREAEALLVPVEGREGKAASPASAPMRTQTARNETAFVVPLRQNNTTLTSAGHQSLVSWQHMVVDYNGPARSPGEPLGTQTTVEGEALASLAVDVDDCEFRMLEPHEIQAAMAFAPEYVLLGNRRERVRLAGNAVTPPAARDLIGTLAEAITGELVA
ncbi:MAG TPA: DNA cytosine methyltransferase [Acidothermaceae bacterium]|jgi:DNA (cytosine-5)-methyltransferase 1